MPYRSYEVNRRPRDAAVHQSFIKTQAKPMQIIYLLMSSHDRHEHVGQFENTSSAVGDNHAHGEGGNSFMWSKAHVHVILW